MDVFRIGPVKLCSNSLQRILELAVDSLIQINNIPVVQ